MRNIQVFYDGEYPNTCRGVLRILIDGEEVYNEQYVCRSSGSVWFDDNWGEHVETGELYWKEEEAVKFDADVREAVANKLSDFCVCCGGCI
jgi:hypothetical protein